jgi:hypothetical protein
LKLLTKLYPFQEWGLRRLERFGGSGLVGFDMGLGKSLVALAHLASSPERWPAVVVCPASVKWTWDREAKAHLGVRAEVLEGTKPARHGFRGRPKLVVINYDILWPWMDWLLDMSPQAVVYDEAHYLSGRTSKRTKAAQHLARHVSCVLALSGTALVNRPAELYPVLQMLRPKQFPSWRSFAFRYCGAKRTPWGWDTRGASRLPELHNRLKATCLVRKRKLEVLKDLPPKQRTVVPVDLDNYTEYKKAANDFIGWLRNKDPGKARKAERAQAISKISHLRLLCGRLKLPSVVGWVRDFLKSDGGKLIVFAVHREVVAALHKAFRGQAVFVDGSVVGHKRQQAIDQFLNLERVRLFVGNVQAAGVGWSARGVSTVAFAEYPWQPGAVTQAEDRCLTENNLVYCRRPGKMEDMSLLKISEVAVGDSVMTHKGRYRRVLKVHKRNETHPLLTSIRYVGWHEPLVCTHDHKILVKREGVERPRWVQAHQLLPTDSMAFPRPATSVRLEEVKIEDRWRVYKDATKPTGCTLCGAVIEARSLCRIHYRAVLAQAERPSKPPQINPRYVRLPDKIRVTTDWLFLFGWYVAEGFSSVIPGKAKFVSFSGHKKERPILEGLARTIERDLGIRSFIREHPVCQAVEMRAHSSEMANWFYEWFGHGAANKRLPRELLNLPQDQAEALLAGYVAGDGNRRSVNGKSTSVRWISKSQRLSEQMVYLAARAGHIPTIRREYPHGSECWVGAYCLGSNPTNKRLADQDDRFIYRPIRSVTTERSKERIDLYDLTVEGDHSYVSGLATVHNCHGLKRGVEGQRTQAFYLVARETIEEQLVRILQKKQAVLTAVLDGAGRGERLDVFDQLIEVLQRGG